MPDRALYTHPPQADPDFRAWANRVCAHFWDRAVLLLVGATLAWWPLDELVFTRDAADRRVLITMRVGLVLSLLGSRWLLRHTRVGRAYTNEVVAACLLPILTGVGWGLWTSSPLTGPVVGFVAAIPLLSIPLLLSLRVRIAVVTGTTATVFAAWLSQRPGVLVDPDVAAGISYAVANVAAAAVVGHVWYRRVADHHRRGQLLAASEEELRGLQAALEARVRLQTEALRKLYDRLESAREEERRAIARELHDELGQDLMGLRLSVQLMRTSLGPRRRERPGRCRRRVGARGGRRPRDPRGTRTGFGPRGEPRAGVGVGRHRGVGLSERGLRRGTSPGARVPPPVVSGASQARASVSVD